MNEESIDYGITMEDIKKLNLNNQQVNGLAGIINRFTLKSSRFFDNALNDIKIMSGGPSYNKMVLRYMIDAFDKFGIKYINPTIINIKNFLLGIISILIGKTTISNEEKISLFENIILRLNSLCRKYGVIRAKIIKDSIIDQIKIYISSTNNTTANNI